MADQTDAEIIDRWLPDIQSGAYKHRMSSLAAIAYVEATAREVQRLRGALQEIADLDESLLPDAWIIASDALNMKEAPE